MENEAYITTYVSKLEGVILDQIRKHVECDTRNTLYASAVQDLQTKLEEKERFGSDMKSALDQALAGLQAVTVEKDEIKTKHEKREFEFELICSELEKVREECRQTQNSLAICTQEKTTLENQMASVNSDNNALRNNYQSVLNTLEECRTQLANTSADYEALKRSYEEALNNLKDHAKQVTVLLKDNEALKRSYEEASKKLEESYDVTENKPSEPEKLSTKKKKTAKDSDWVDGN